MSDAFILDTVGDSSLLKLLGGSGQDAHGDAESDDAPACKISSSSVACVVAQPFIFEAWSSIPAASAALVKYLCVSSSGSRRR